MIHAVGEPAERGRVFTLTSPFIVPRGVVHRDSRGDDDEEGRTSVETRARTVYDKPDDPHLYTTNVENVRPETSEDFACRESSRLAKATRFVRDNARRTLTAHTTRMYCTTTTPDAAAASRKGDGKKGEGESRADFVRRRQSSRAVERPPIATDNASASNQSTHSALTSNVRQRRGSAGWYRASILQRRAVPLSRREGL